MKVLAIISFFILLNSILAGCINPSDDDVNEVSIVIGMHSDISGFYPFTDSRDTNTVTVNRNIYSTLVEIEKESYNYIPALAENWNNPDNLTWRFYLRKNITFHNGYKFTSEDVKFSIEYMNKSSYYGTELSPISDIILLDDYTIDIKTKEPYPTLLNKLLTLFIISKKYIQENNEMNASIPIGTGAYLYKEYKPMDHITLERYDEYWKKKSDVKTIIFKIFNNTDESKNAFMNYSVNIIPISFENIETILERENVTIKSVNSPGIVYLSFDFRENNSYGFKEEINPLSNLSVRKAFYHAINIEELIDVFFNNSVKPASQFVTDYVFGFNSNIKRLPFNLTLANKYMNDSGYSNGFSIVIDCIDTNASIDFCNLIANQLSKINVNVTLNPLPIFEYYSKLYYKNTSFYIMSWNAIDADQIINSFLHTPDGELGGANYGYYSNDQIDNFSKKISHTIDPKIRKELIHTVFSIATEDIAWIPLYSYIAYYAMDSKIHWNPRPSLFLWVEDIEIL
jgi:peptide/nickel transport system substrate-binding protein